MQIHKPTTPTATVTRPQGPARTPDGRAPSATEEGWRGDAAATNPGTLEYASWLQLLRQRRG